MAESYITEGMAEMFLYESEQLLEQLEQIALTKEKEGRFDDASINEIFRIMHTIKGSSGIMMYSNITSVSHKLEDVFYYLRETHPTDVPNEELIGHILDAADFIKNELEKIKNGQSPDGDPKTTLVEIEKFLERIKNHIQKTGTELPPENKEKIPARFYIAPVANENSHFYLINIFYREDTEMVNIRAYTAVYALKEIAEDMKYDPEDIITNENTAEVIFRDGFLIALQSQVKQDAIMNLIDGSGIGQIDIKECTPTEFLYMGKNAPVINIDADRKEDYVLPAESNSEANRPEAVSVSRPSISEMVKPSELFPKADKETKKENPAGQTKQSFISVNVVKMDMLMDLIGELVIAEAMVLQNPDLKVPGLDLTNFSKTANQLNKITTELQETIMSMRMMPLGNTFQKMNRIVYDMSKKLDKDIELVIIGENTEVDKNIIEHISDPLMHLIRNSVDHGIETKEDREKTDKSPHCTVTLEAKNEGGKVWISVKDDGKGLSREKLLKKAKENNLLNGRNEKELSDKEVYQLITLPGFSTKDNVTEFSGRGVGMDVVMQNIQAVGGSLDIESIEGYGSTMIMKIPLTLAIVDGIVFRVGKTTYVVPTGDVQQFLGVKKDQMIIEPDGTESIMLRGECYPVLRLKQYYHLSEGIDNIEDGIIALLEHEGKQIAIFVDELCGEQEIVVKPIPSYIKRVKGLSGCTQLGDGSISLILDTASLIK